MGRNKHICHSASTSSFTARISRDFHSATHIPSMIHLYVEHLLNIKTLSIQASLSTVSNKETKATLAADGSVLTLTHEGETASIQLPINLSPRKESNIKLTIPAVPSRELNFRVQLEEKEGQDNSVLPNGDRDDGNIVPWTADSLVSETEVCCKFCNTALVERGRIQTWKDLPSEGWAEMMEFWHCHKPHEPHNHSDGEVKKGYTAGSKLAVESGVGMVDALDFVFLPEDCKNISISDSQDNPQGDDAFVKCTKCDNFIGRTDHSTGAHKLRKLYLSISTHQATPPLSYEIEKWLGCLLLSAMENQGVRKLEARKSADDKSVLKLWIFTPDLTISSSAMPSAEPARFVKVLWQDAEAPVDGSERLNAVSLSEGELKLHDAEVDLLRSTLEKGGELIPENARTFQDWNIGLLKRFTASDMTPS